MVPLVPVGKSLICRPFSPIVKKSFRYSLVDIRQAIPRHFVVSCDKFSFEISFEHVLFVDCIPCTVIHLSKNSFLLITEGWMFSLFKSLEPTCGLDVFTVGKMADKALQINLGHVVSFSLFTETFTILKFTFLRFNC